MTCNIFSPYLVRINLQNHVRNIGIKPILREKYTVCVIVWYRSNQLHARAYVLVYQHMCVNMLPFMCDRVLASLTYCTRMLHEGLHTRMCYSSGYKLVAHMYVLFACTTVRMIHVHFTKNYIRVSLPQFDSARIDTSLHCKSKACCTVSYCAVLHSNTCVNVLIEPI